jgi:hypothetical protein
MTNIKNTEKPGAEMGNMQWKTYNLNKIYCTVLAVLVKDYRLGHLIFPLSLFPTSPSVLQSLC